MKDLLSALPFNPPFHSSIELAWFSNECAHLFPLLDSPPCKGTQLQNGERDLLPTPIWRGSTAVLQSEGMCLILAIQHLPTKSECMIWEARCTQPAVLSSSTSTTHSSCSSDNNIQHVCADSKATTVSQNSFSPEEHLSALLTSSLYFSSLLWQTALSLPLPETDLIKGTSVIPLSPSHKGPGFPLHSYRIFTLLYKAPWDNRTDDHPQQHETPQHRWRGLGLLMWRLAPFDGFLL